MRVCVVGSVVLVACSFDTSGLQPPRFLEAGVDRGADFPISIEGGADLPDGPRPERLRDGLPPREGRIDLPRPDLPKPDQPKPSCTPTPSVCQGQAPVCDGTTGACRACAAHPECAGGLCRADGSCPPESSISFVDDDCSSTRDGSTDDPYCKINDAVGKPPPYILVRAGVYTADTILNANKEVYGEPGAKLEPTACNKIVFDGKPALLSGFEISGNVLYKGGAKGTLLRNRIGPSACIGVDTDGNAANEVILDRNLIFSHTGGGMLLDGKYTVRNNIIVKNGAAPLTWGAVKIVAADAASLFINNTVANNDSKGSNAKEAGGVRCEPAAAGAKFHNTIFWGNTFNDAGDPTQDRQYGPGCQALFSLEELKSGATPGPNNISLDPQFAATGLDTSAFYYRVQKTSPAKDKGTKTSAPAVDYDGEPRQDGKPDIGADEL